MGLKITIDYTYNQNKAGKLTCVDDFNNVILDKVAISIPESVQNLNNFQLTFTPKEMLSLDEKYLGKKLEFSHSLKHLVTEFETKVGKIFLTNDKTNSSDKNDFYFGSIKSNSTNIQNNSCFSFENKEDYNKLLKNIGDNKKISVFGNRKLFLFFQKDVQKTSIDFFANKEMESIRIRYNSEKDKLVNDINRLMDFEREQQRKAEKSQKDRINEENKLRAEKERIRRLEEERAREREIRNYDSDSALDTLFMYSNPELAPFFKPNSALAWMLYFNHDNHHDIQKHIDYISPESSMDIKKNINSIAGFENIQGVDVKNSANHDGYCVKLYADANKTEYVGSVRFDKNNGYSITDNCGNSFELQQNNDKIFEGTIKGDSNDSYTNISFVPTENGFKGNWEIGSESNSSMKIEAGFNFDKKEQVLDSKVGESYPSVELSKELNQLEKTLAKIVDDYFSVRTGITNEYLGDSIKVSSPKIGDSYEPPPPPPPPKETFNYNTDPYNNSSSFSM